MQTTQKPAVADIARTAYFIWEQEGRPHGRDQAHWLQAEKLLTRSGPSAAKSDGKAAAKPATIRTARRRTQR